MTNHHDDTPEPTRGDRLDSLLRGWHDRNKDAARASRDTILTELDGALDRERSRGVIGRIGIGRMLSAAAVLAFAAVLAIVFVRTNDQKAFALGGIVQVAEGGALDALDEDGGTLGPCPLQHTDVRVEISGLFARTIVEQTYANPYPRTIEAVYTFPLSERAAVDRMTMVLSGPSGEKFVEGEVRERSLARAMYEEARESGFVASLLEQERPNIFTQSVANIEPGATVKVRIATIEIARRRDGVAEYVFPMVVGPRYIPGAAPSLPSLPEGWIVRQGVVLRAPAAVELTAQASLSAMRISALLEKAIPIRAVRHEQIDELVSLGEGISFTAKYGNGSAERGMYFPQRGIGDINGRFFYAPLATDQGTGFSGDTDQVPDASRITPMPVKPSERAGNDISVSVAIDSGGPAITDVSSELHAVRVANPGASKRSVTLEDRKTIPNRDFILRWKVADSAIEPSFFAHTSDSTDGPVKGGYFALMLEPPVRVAPAEIRPRELVFVLDVSGSMNGFPIEKSKALARQAIASMRPGDTFNFITFAGATSVLWPEPRVASEENRRIAEEFVNGAYSAGGTEMMAAVTAALAQDGRGGIAPARLLDLPADGRGVRVAVPHDGFKQEGGAWKLDAGGGRMLPVDLSIAIPANPKRLAFIVDGAWETRGGDRVLVAKTGRFEDADARTRFVFFLTDGYIGNDQGVIAAVREHARASRVFSFGIGNSVNRFLLEEMARAGRGACEVVTLSEEADAVIDRLVRRIESPVLTDIALEIPPSLGLRDLLPGGDHLPDLYDQEPIVLLGRFDRAASGAITVRGRTGAGQWERTIPVSLPAIEPSHDVVKTLWARAKVDEVLAPNLAAVESQSLAPAIRQQVVRLGEAYAIATPYTSFVAVEKSRVVVGGKPMLVAVPVELPDGTSWAGMFGDTATPFDSLTSSAPLSAGVPNSGAPGSPPAPTPTAGAAAPAPVTASVRAPEVEKGKREILADRKDGTPSPTSAPSSAASSAGRPAAPVESLRRQGSEMRVEERVAGGSTLRFTTELLVPSEPSRRRDAGRGGSVLGGGAGGGAFGGGGVGGMLDRSAGGFGAVVAEGLDDDFSKGSVSMQGLGEQLTETERDRLARVLDRRLVLVALAVTRAAEGIRDAQVRALAAELGVTIDADGLVEVALKIDASAIERLRALGATVDAEDRTRNLVVARIPASKLAQLAAIEGVRRVEPLRR